MSKPIAPQGRGPLDRPQRLEIGVRVGKRVRVRTMLEISPAGLLAIGGLVSGVLLSTTLLVRTSRRNAPGTAGGTPLLDHPDMRQVR